MMDLLRPDSPEEAQAIVNRYAAKEPEILRRDFYRSCDTRRGAGIGTRGEKTGVAGAKDAFVSLRGRLDRNRGAEERNINNR